MGKGKEIASMTVLEKPLTFALGHLLLLSAF